MAVVQRDLKPAAAVKTAQTRARIGVLALQGDFEKHLNMLGRIETADAGLVRTPADILNCDGLIIPGGESSTVGKLMVRYGIDEAIKARHAQGMAIFGTVLVEPGSVRVTVYASECKLGALGSDAEHANSIAQTFTICGIPTLPTANIISEKWMKAFYNIALNPLSAILQVPYGVLGEMEETRKIMRLALGEAFAVASAEKVELSTSADKYFQHLLDVQLPPTSRHQSSMLQDIRRGRKTEIDYLNGIVVNRGQTHGIPTPVNELLVNIVKALEKSSAPHSA